MISCQTLKISFEKLRRFIRFWKILNLVLRIHYFFLQTRWMLFQLCCLWTYFSQLYCTGLIVMVIKPSAISEIWRRFIFTAQYRPRFFCQKSWDTTRIQNELDVDHWNIAFISICTSLNFSLAAWILSCWGVKKRDILSISDLFPFDGNLSEVCLVMRFLVWTESMGNYEWESFVYCTTGKNWNF